MSAWLVRWLVPFVLLFLAGGCSYTYTPRPSNRVAMVMHAGTPSFMRGGRLYEGGLFGGGLEDAVRGVPDAEEHARAFTTGMIGGFLLGMAGSLSLCVGTGMALWPVGSDSTSQSGRLSPTNIAGLGLLTGGVAAIIGGLVWSLSAQPHLYDAINSYNDATTP